MHEKKDVWKTDGIGIGWGYGIVGRGRVGETPVHRQRIQKAETSASSGAETSSEKNQSPLDGQTLFRRNSSDIRSMDPQEGWIHHLER